MEDICSRTDTDRLSFGRTAAALVFVVVFRVLLSRGRDPHAPPPSIFLHHHHCLPPLHGIFHVPPTLQS